MARIHRRVLAGELCARTSHTCNRVVIFAHLVAWAGVGSPTIDWHAFGGNFIVLVAVSTGLADKFEARRGDTNNVVVVDTDQSLGTWICRTRHGDTLFAIGIILVAIIAVRRIIVVDTLVVHRIPDKTFRTSRRTSRAHKRRTAAVLAVWIGSRNTCVSTRERERDREREKTQGLRTIFSTPKKVCCLLAVALH